MAAPKVSVTLMDMRKVNREGSDFKVIKLANTIEFKIDDYLTTADVQSLCDDEETNVIITPFKR